MKNLLLALLCCISFMQIHAQAPQGIPYQSIIRNGNGNLLINQSIQVRFTIHDSTMTGNIVYQETHTTTTSAAAMIILTIGQGTVVSGNFSTINWGNGAKFMQVELNASGGNNYVNLGTQQMMSVPFALYAKTSAEVISPVYSIGLNPALGGYIFWVSSDGKHGLVCETQDQGTNVSLYVAYNIISNPFNHSLNGAVFHDWRIPSKYELNILYLNRIAIGGFSNNDYWSSSEFSYSDAWCQYFLNGIQAETSKNNPAYIRSVRSF